MRFRTLLLPFFAVSVCLVMASPASAQSTKKKPKQIVVVGSKVKDVVREAGSTDSTSLNPPALDDRSSKELDTDEKKDTKSKDASHVREPASPKRPSGVRTRKTAEKSEQD